MKKLFAIMAIMIMVLGASMTCIAATETYTENAVVAVAMDNGAADQSVATDVPAQSSQAKKGELSIGAKIGASVGAGCLVSLIIVLVMISGMNTARAASEADAYYKDENVRIAVKSDRYTHTTRHVTKKQTK